MAYEVVLLDGSDRRFVLNEGDELTIGVAAHCGIRLSAPDVSRQHALIACRGGRLIVMDLGSKNGTTVAGRRIAGETELAPGETVRLSSVPLQVLPAQDGPSSAVDGIPSSSSLHTDTDAGRPTSDHAVPVIETTIQFLLERWANVEATATGCLVEWVVAWRGMRGAAVVEQVGDDVNVVAAHGAMVGRLPRRGRLSSLGLGSPGGRVPETVTINLDGERILAISQLGMPWLLVLPGEAMPDISELDLLAKLLAVAARIDRPAGGASVRKPAMLAPER